MLLLLLQLLAVAEWAVGEREKAEVSQMQYIFVN